MKLLSHRVTVPALTAVVLALVGCGISKDEYEKSVSELNKARAEILKAKDELEGTKKEANKTRAELAKTMVDLEKANTKIVDMEKSFTIAQNQLKMTVERHKKEKQAIQAPLLSTRHEAVYLRQKLDELIHALKKSRNELIMARKANEILRGQMNKLTNERNQLQERVENQQAKFTELERKLKAFQAPASK